MNIELHEVTVGEIYNGYLNRGDNGVRGLGGKLDIRPPYQRNFVYDDKKRNDVVRTVKKNFPLNVMYWVIRDDETFEVMDGQQRTISICDYVHGDFSVDGYYFHSLSEKFRRTILDYKLTIYFCRGDEDEKLAWFQVVNIAGEKLYDQEIRNAVYAGRFVNEARSYFSQSGCAAERLAKKYLKCDRLRQEYLETALKWVSERDGVSIEDYMSKHKFDNAQDLKTHFNTVIAWVKWLFPKYYDDLRGLDWGKYYNQYGEKNFDVEAVSRRVEQLRDDDEVQSLSGIYKYILTGEEKHLNLRTFDKTTKKRVYRRQDGKCKLCGKRFAFEQMEADHIDPWSKGGKTTEDNCQLLCKQCNRRKSNA